MFRTDVFSANKASDIEFWRAVCPEMTVEGDHPHQQWDLPPTVSPTNLLLREGYLNQPGIIPQTLTDQMFAAVRKLRETGIPPAFSFVYDEFWLIFRNLSPLLKKILGNDYLLMPSLWTWYVPPSDSAAGWVPHRDRKPRCIRDDLSPNTVVVWLPLTDATVLNGCMYVLPAHLDESFAKRDWSEKSSAEYAISGSQLQNIRALPAPAGSVLLWNGLLLHWGSRASALGTHPRCSTSLQFQRADVAPFEQPLLDPAMLPPFQDRLGYIGEQIVRYAKFASLDGPNALLIALALKTKFFPKQPAVTVMNPLA
jgi:hypothetical protein